MPAKFSLFLIAVIFLSACAQPAAQPAPKPDPSNTPAPAASAPSASPTTTITPSATLVPTATIVPTATLPPATDLIKGLVYFPAGWGGDGRPESDWILKNIALPTGANWIRIPLSCNQYSARKTQIDCRPDQDVSDQDYIHVVKTAHSLGLRVMSENLLWVPDPEGFWAGDIGRFYNEAQWAEWFANYTKMILHYASLAEQAGTDHIIVISELDATAKREKEWREVIAQVRQVYHGKVSIAFDEEFALRDVKFWDAVDVIGVHPYYMNLPGVIDPSVEQLTKAYKPYVYRLEALSKKWDKPILLDEIGYWSVHTQTQNYNNLDSSNQIDLQEQTNLFQAFFNSFYGKEWVSGFFCFAIEGGSNYAEPWNTRNDFIGKPAENVIRSFYGAPPFPTPTPVVFPSTDLPNEEWIYQDSLSPSWSNYPPEGDFANINYGQTEVAVSGDALRVKLLHFWSLDFRSDHVDWSKFQWLEFDLYVEASNLPKVYSLGVLQRDTTYHPSLYRVELLQSQFIEDGKLQPGKWQHVRIPLDVFGPRLSQYIYISIDRPGAGRENPPLVFYVDNMVLRGK